MNEIRDLEPEKFHTSLGIFNLFIRFVETVTGQYKKGFIYSIRHNGSTICNSNIYNAEATAMLEGTDDLKERVEKLNKQIK